MITTLSSGLQVTELLSSLGFLSFLESGYGCVEAGPNLVDKLQAAISRGKDRYSVLPARTTEIEILTVPDADGQAPGTCGCLCGVYILNDGKYILPKVKGAVGLRLCFYWFFLIE